MWAALCRTYRRLVDPPPPPRIFLGTPSFDSEGTVSEGTVSEGIVSEGIVSEGTVVEICLGYVNDASAKCDARLGDSLNPKRLRSVVRFCARRRLPVAAWVVTGVWHLPGRVDETARWLVLLCQDADGAVMYVDTAPMPAHYLQRLRAHLIRLGCSIV